MTRVDEQLASLQEASLPRIFGRYLLVERLNRGGMGEIFLARHGMTGFEKLVVIKKVLPHLAADREFLTRFIDEAQVAVHLQHANIAQVFEVGRVLDEYFLALEYISGSDLRATMAALAARRQAMPVELALFIAREVANGLAYAHRRTDAGGAPLALVHCDISPPNVMVSFEGEVKIIDFGIARSSRRVTETNPDRGFGKFGYLAPEQLLKGLAVDQRTDVYALGVVLFEMLTGRHMFELGKQPDYRMLARQVVRGEHPLPSAISQTLAPYDDLVAMALRPNANERYQTAAEFRDAIQRALVTVSPTINPDHLAALLRRIVGDDIARRRKVASLKKSELERWQRQLTTQAGSTVSFAMAAGERTVSDSHLPTHARFDLGGDQPGGGTRSGRRGPGGATGPHGALRGSRRDQEPHSTIARGIRFGALRRYAWWHRRTAISAGILLMAGVLGASALYATRHLLRGKSRPPLAATSAQGAVVPPAAAPAPASSPLPVAAPGHQQSLAEIQVRELPPDEADPESTQETRQANRVRRKVDRKRTDDRRSDAEEADDDVQRRFRVASQEYSAFKERYGTKLEREWNELTGLAAKPRSAGGEELDRKIGEFRAQMRAIQSDKDRSIDPF